MPFKWDHKELAENFEMCKGKLKNLKHRLERDSLTERYDIVIKEYEHD
jgi:hypothetical protein